jgi:hypothetical protein
MSEQVSVVVTGLDGRRVLAGQWAVPHPQARAFDDAALEVGRAVMSKLYDPGVLAVQVMPSAVARRTFGMPGSAVTVHPVDVIRAAAQDYQLVEGEFYQSTDRVAVRARWLAMYLIRSLIGLSFPAIGALFDRDHSTVMYGVNEVKRLIRDSGSDIAERLHRVESLLQGELAPQYHVELVPARVRTL